MDLKYINSYWNNVTIHITRQDGACKFSWNYSRAMSLYLRSQSTPFFVLLFPEDCLALWKVSVHLGKLSFQPKQQTIRPRLNPESILKLQMHAITVTWTTFCFQNRKYTSLLQVIRDWCQKYFCFISASRLLCTDGLVPLHELEISSNDNCWMMWQKQFRNFIFWRKCLLLCDSVIPIIKS